MLSSSVIGPLSGDRFPAGAQPALDSFFRNQRSRVPSSFQSRALPLLQVRLRLSAVTGAGAEAQHFRDKRSLTPCGGYAEAGDFVHAQYLLGDTPNDSSVQFNVSAKRLSVGVPFAVVKYQVGIMNSGWRLECRDSGSLRADWQGNVTVPVKKPAPFTWVYAAAVVTAQVQVAGVEVARSGLQDESPILWLMWGPL